MLSDGEVGGGGLLLIDGTLAVKVGDDGLIDGYRGLQGIKMDTPPLALDLTKFPCPWPWCQLTFMLGLVVCLLSDKLLLSRFMFSLFSMFVSVLGSLVDLAS